MKTVSCGVYQFRFDNGKFVKCYESIREAERITKVRKTSISDCCKGLRKEAGGFIWIRKADYE